MSSEILSLINTVTIFLISTCIYVFLNFSFWIFGECAYMRPCAYVVTRSKTDIPGVCNLHVTTCAHDFSKGEGTSVHPLPCY